MLGVTPAASDDYLHISEIVKWKVMVEFAGSPLALQLVMTQTHVSLNVIYPTQALLIGACRELSRFGSLRLSHAERSNSTTTFPSPRMPPPSAISTASDELVLQAAQVPHAVLLSCRPASLQAAPDGS